MAGMCANSACTSMMQVFEDEMESACYRPGGRTEHTTLLRCRTSAQHTAQHSTQHSDSTHRAQHTALCGEVVLLTVTRHLCPLLSPLVSRPEHGRASDQVFARLRRDLRAVLLRVRPRWPSAPFYPFSPFLPVLLLLLLQILLSFCVCICFCSLSPAAAAAAPALPQTMD